jgi:hypothetical protein
MQDDPRADAMLDLGSIIFIPSALLSAVMLIYYLTRGLLTKVVNYKCMYCKNKFIEPVQIP